MNFQEKIFNDTPAVTLPFHPYCVTYHHVTPGLKHFVYVELFLCKQIAKYFLYIKLFSLETNSNIKKKSRIREALNLLMCVDSSTDKKK